jgi:hypothetical protein
VLVLPEDKAIVELVVALLIIDDEATVKLTVTGPGEVMILCRPIDELGRLLELVPPTETDGKVLEFAKQDDTIVVDDMNNGASVTDG